MKFNLIADAGSTKTEWALLPTGEEVPVRFVTDGLNAVIATSEMVRKNFSAAAEEAMTAAKKSGAEAEIGSIHYYGAGCATPEICSRTEDALLSAFGAETARADSDLTGAARSLLGEDAGVACIIGTGSNSCLYDGRQIVANVPSLGFILGDEGSGAALGRRLVNATFKGHLPSYLEKELTERHGLSLPKILDAVYRAPAPNRFLASLVPLVKEYVGDPYIHSIVLEEFGAFFSRNISRYKGVRSLPISFTGGVAAAFSDILEEAAAEQGYTLGRIEAAPMDGLIAYHKAHTDI